MAEESTTGDATMDLTSVKDALKDVANDKDDAIDANDDDNDDADDDDRIVYTEEELETMREVKRRLEEEKGVKYVNPRFLAYTVIVSKGRVDESTKKYSQFLKSIAPFDYSVVESDDDLWNKDSDATITFLKERYVPCGTDHEGRQVFWIRGDMPIMPHEERPSVRAGILYVIAIHGDKKSLREGITFVIDTSKNKPKVGNESKLQKMNQSFPLRPQAIYLAGASATMRVVINGLIRIASFFSKQKVLDRIRFVTLEQAIASIPKESGPKYLGGGGGGIEDVVEWTRRRYEKLPVPNL